jgi:SHS2 domain-containing protein
MLTELKSVSYHHLNIERAADGWKARITFEL